MKRTTPLVIWLVIAAAGNAAAQVPVRPEVPPIAARGQPPAAKVVTFSCTQIDHKPGTAPSVITLRVNYTIGLVEQLAPSGKAYTNRVARNARISENAIVWSARLMDTGLAKPVPMIWEGTIDRLSGATWDEWSREPHQFVQRVRTNYTCRVAARIDG